MSFVLCTLAFITSQYICNEYRLFTFVYHFRGDLGCSILVGAWINRLVLRELWSKKSLEIGPIASSQPLGICKSLKDSLNLRTCVCLDITPVLPPRRFVRLGFLPLAAPTANLLPLL